MMHEFSSDPRLLPGSAILGETVSNFEGEPLGEVKDLIVDLKAGVVAYLVLSFGGFLGLGKKLFVVPWTAITQHPEDDGFLLDMRREHLERAPGFDRDDWPDLSDRRWGTEIHRFYNARPYWTSSVPRMQYREA